MQANFDIVPGNAREFRENFGVTLALLDVDYNGRPWVTMPAKSRVLQ